MGCMRLFICMMGLLEALRSARNFGRAKSKSLALTRSSGRNSSLEEVLGLLIRTRMGAHQKQEG